MRLRSEEKFVFYCCKTELDTQALNQIKRLLLYPLRWDGILENVILHGLSMSVYCNLNKISHDHLIPSGFMEKLRRTYYANTARNMVLYSELERVLKHFKNEGIKTIVLKGAVLAETVYSSIALRSMRDIDLLIHKRDLDKAEKKLLELGYILNEHYGPGEWYREKHHHLAPFFNPNKIATIEVHNDIISPSNPFATNIDDFWQRAQSAKIANSDVLILSPEDLILHLSLHISYHDRFAGRIRGLFDISEVVRHYQEKINWNQITTEIYKYNIGKFVYYPLYFAKELLDADIPSDVLAELEYQYRLPLLEDQLLKFITRRNLFIRNGVSSILPTWVIQSICRELLCDKKTYDKVKSLIRLIILPGKGDNSSEPFHYHRFMIRLLRLFPKYGITSLLMIYGKVIHQLHLLKRNRY